MTRLNAGEVDHEPAVGDGEAGDVVAAAADADLQVALAGRAHRGDDVGDASRTGTISFGRWSIIAFQTERAASYPRIAGGEDLAVEAGDWSTASYV